MRDEHENNWSREAREYMGLSLNDVRQAAYEWVGRKDRETSNDDVVYFMHNWWALPGMRAHVAEHTITRSWAAQIAAIEDERVLKETINESV